MLVCWQEKGGRLSSNENFYHARLTTGRHLMGICGGLTAWQQGKPVEKIIISRNQETIGRTPHGKSDKDSTRDRADTYRSGYYALFSVLGYFLWLLVPFQQYSSTALTYTLWAKSCPYPPAHAALSLSSRRTYIIGTPVKKKAKKITESSLKRDRNNI